jgi:hypothetical protein
MGFLRFSRTTMPGDIVSEPLFVTIRLIYDGTVEVEVQTFTGRHGMTGGGSLPGTW